MKNNPPNEKLNPALIGSYEKLIKDLATYEITPDILTKLYNSQILKDKLGTVVRVRAPGNYFYFESYNLHLEAIVYRDSKNNEITEQYYNLVSPVQEVRKVFKPLANDKDSK